MMAALTMPCTHCQTPIPCFPVSDHAYQAVVRALCHGSKTLAAAELSYFVPCLDSDAQAWVGHLLLCAYAWPAAKPDQDVLLRIDQAFAGLPKPEHFTRYTHCDECKEHDDTLRARTVDTLQRKDLGNLGYDPLTFCNAEGIGYFFPVLVRYALLPDIWRDRDWYGSQMISHLSWDGGKNRFLGWCSPTQRGAVYTFLQHLMATRSDNLSIYGDHDNLRAALSIWEPPNHPDR